MAAMASYLDARAHDGVWLVRIEDVDKPRDLPWAGEHILRTLAALGLESDESVLWQHDRDEAYQQFSINSSPKERLMVAPAHDAILRSLTSVLDSP